MSKKGKSKASAAGEIRADAVEGAEIEAKWKLGGKDRKKKKAKKAKEKANGVRSYKYTARQLTEGMEPLPDRS